MCLSKSVSPPIKITNNNYQEASYQKLHDIHETAASDAHLMKIFGLIILILIAIYLLIKLYDYLKNKFQRSVQRMTHENIARIDN